MLAITSVIKFPERKIKSLLLDKWKNMTKQILFSQENAVNTWQARVWNIFGKVVGKRLEKIITPIACDKERAGEDFIKAKNHFTVRQNKLSK